MGSSRRDFIRRTLFGAAIGHLLPCAASAFAKDDSGLVDRRRLGRMTADVSILGLGLGGAFMDGYERSRDAGHALLESALAKGISLDGVSTAIVGLDSSGHLNENATVAIKFKPMQERGRAELSRAAGGALATIPAPWERTGYIDGERVG